MESLLIFYLAEGNPDEEKIGAFGVGVSPSICYVTTASTSVAGFYSLFSITEEPFVTSGGLLYR